MFTFHWKSSGICRYGRIKMNIKKGDYIKDIKMSMRKGYSIQCKVIRVTKNRFVCDNEAFPQAYPHSFFNSSENIEWEKIN